MVHEVNRRLSDGGRFFLNLDGVRPPDPARCAGCTPPAASAPSSSPPRRSAASSAVPSSASVHGSPAAGGRAPLARWAALIFARASAVWGLPFRPGFLALWLALPPFPFQAGSVG